MPAWQHWFHCTTHTYGTWLRGDPRGWRTRNHREHVEGDYKSPPAIGTGESLHSYSKHLMKRKAVKIHNADILEFAVIAIVEKLSERNIRINAVCFDGIHLHALIQCPNDDPKIMLGIAKQFATAQLKAHGLAVGMNLELGQGIWPKGSGVKPIRDANHFDNASDYIRDHINQGAVVWEHNPN